MIDAGKKYIKKEPIPYKIWRFCWDQISHSVRAIGPYRT